MDSANASSDLREVAARWATRIADDFSHVTVRRRTAPFAVFIKTLALVREVGAWVGVLAPDLFAISPWKTSRCDSVSHDCDILG